MRLAFLFLPLLAFPLWAAPVDLRNDREGETIYSSKSDKRAMKKAIRDLGDQQIARAYEDALSETDSNKLCSFDLNKSLLKNLKDINPDVYELKGSIIYLRTKNYFDDITAKILLSADKTVNTALALPKVTSELFYPDKKTLAESLKIMAKFEKKSQGQCLDEAYKTLYSDLLKYNKNIKSAHVEAILVEAYTNKHISYDTYILLEKARENELESQNLNLKTYFKKIQSLRTQYPLRDPEEKSDFVTTKANKIDASRRQFLLENYTDLQIMIMSNVVKKLRTRLESPKAEILIYDRNQGVETITLEPMERFRLAIKLLRKEMSLLALNTYFAGRAPSYMDLMIAAYETGTIPASELKAVAELEEVWNPKKTFWQKAEVWVRTFSSVVTVALPPPYGFVPALALVVIEMTAGAKSDNTNDPTVLF